MRGATVAVACTPEAGHYRLLRPLIHGLAQRGARVVVLGHESFAADVQGLGAVPVDVYAKYSVAAADDASLPVPCRYVTHAVRFADELRRDLAALRPALLVHETFALGARLAAAALDVPYVNVSPCHDLEPARTLARLQADPRARVSAACLRAVEDLRDVHAMADASPFSYATATSPFLNVYCEPETFLRDDCRAALEPVVCFGSLPPRHEWVARADDPPAPWAAPRRYRVYASFGTVVWRYFAEQAFGTLLALADAIDALPDAEAVIGLGGADPGRALLDRLTRDHVRVLVHADQWSVLAGADAFLTHHGINSTHEAIHHGVPMLSCPFFADQWDLAKRCQELGLALPLPRPPGLPASREQLLAALLDLRAGDLSPALARAKQWELDTVARRDAVLDRIAALAK